ncbi:MAG: hypothetical protein OIF40_10465 [Mangrovicoccus sp.]|nr:hypothetical protein [Mangrovicoccus sp.]
MRPKKTKGWNGYLDWAAELTGAHMALGKAAKGASPKVSDAPLWEPIFVRSKGRAISTEAFFDAAAATKGIRFDPFERDYNLWARAPGQPVEAFLYRRYRRKKKTPFEKSFKVLAAGALVTAAGQPVAAATPLARAEAPDHGPAPIAAAVIDDGIGFLNGRFRAAPQQTRFVAFWVQALARRQGASQMQIGQVLEQEQIQEMLCQTRIESEEESYSHLAGQIYGPGTRHSLRHVNSHGTPIMDLTAGADLSDPEQADMRDVPLLGVQLPPQSFDDTSGTRLQTHFLQALRWLLYTTFAHDKLAERLVINASLGIVAGPKNGRSFLEQQIARELDRLPGAVDLLMPFGSAYEDNLIARRCLEPDQAAAFDLRLAFDDRTPSFVELRLEDDGQDLETLEVTLTAPDGGRYTAQVPAGKHVSFKRQDKSLMARLYHIGARKIWDGRAEPAYLTLAFAPTVGFSPKDLTAPAGRWDVSVKNTGGAAVALSIQVQRDDAVYRRQIGARQARLDHPNAHDWNPHWRDFSALGTAGPITHHGSQSAYASVPHDQFHSAGGALVRPGEVEAGDDIRPASYAAAGGDWTAAPAPSASALSETHTSEFGLRAAGLFSASTTRLSGSSTASASLSRDRITALAKGTPPHSYVDRLGGATVLDTPARRDRP